MEEPRKKKHKIDNIEGFLMVFVALLFDAPQIVFEWIGIGFLINWLITVFAFLTFTTWFALKGVSIFRIRRLGVMLGSFIIDIIPGTDATVILAFTWTLSVSATILITRAKEETRGLKGVAGTVGRLATRRRIKSKRSKRGGARRQADTNYSKNYGYREAI